MCRLSKRIEIPGTEAVRVRQNGDKVELMLIDRDGAVQLVPVQMEIERPATNA
jgi:hypothetical protein